MTGDQEIHRRLDSMETNMSTAISELTGAVKNLVVLETEHHATRETLARYGAKLDVHDKRLDTIEQITPRVTRFLDRWDKISLALTIATVLAVSAAILGITYG